MDINEPIMTGTTIAAVTFNEGVIIAADTRTSMGTYVSCRMSNKITQLTDNIYCCRSGRASHTQCVARLVSQFIKKFSMNDNKEASVRDAAIFTSKIISNYPLVASMIIAGYDDDGKGSVYSVNLGGTLLKRDWAVGGSGSAFIYGYADSTYNENMTFEQRVNFAKQLVKLAIKRDNSSGGCIRISIIRKEGVEKHFIPGNELC